MEEEKEKLREAARNGDVEFLRQCVAAHKPNHFYLTPFPKRNGEDKWYYGNILHIAAEAEQEEWIREVIIKEELLLPVEVIQQLLCQPQDDRLKCNPLHLAAVRGNVKIVKMFLKAFPINKQQEEEEEKKKKMKDDDSHHHHHDVPNNNSNYPPPWLMTDGYGRTPCHSALICRKEEIGLEILSMDKESLSNMLDNGGQSLLGLALAKSLDKVAKEILISSPRSSFSTIDGKNAMHLVPKCTSSSERGKGICKLLLQKFPDLIQQISDDGESVFHTWAKEGKIWPFECLLESNDFIPDVRKVFVDLISKTNKFGANPLHNLNPDYINLEAKYSSRKERAQIGKLLIDIYREEANTLTLFDPAGELQYPWLVQDNKKRTPLDYAMKAGNEEFAHMILLEDKNVLKTCLKDVLFVAIQKSFHPVPLKILEIVDENEGLQYLLTNAQELNALHLAPQCRKRGKGICKLLLQKFPDLIQQISDDGESVFHTWAKEGKIWPFECLLESNDFIPDVRKVFVDLISKTNKFGANPLHNLNPNYINLEAKYSSRKERAQIGKLLIDIYREEANTLTLFDPAGELQYPWLVQDNKKRTPLDYAMKAGNEEFAHMILSEDKNVLKACLKDVLFVAIQKSFHQVPLKILEIVDENEGLQYLLTNAQELNALHLAPQCGRDFCEKLMKKHPELIEGVNKEGETILHKWVKIGQVWPFEYILNFIENNQRWVFPFRGLLKAYDKNDRNNPLHVAATCTNNESTLQIVKLLVQDFQKQIFIFRPTVKYFPWYAKNKRDEGALDLAIRCQQDQQLAIYLLSPSLLSHIKGSMAGLLDYYEPKEHLILFLAMEKNYFEVVNKILTKLNKANCSKYLQDSSTRTNILHLASTCTDAEFVRWLIGEVPSELITTPDKDGMSPLGKACEVGASKIVKLMLEKYPSEAFRKEPLAWVKACENGHVSVIQEFVDCCPEKFSYHCLNYKDTPLHHIKLRNLTRYEDFLKIQYMKDLINSQDSDEATPLHKAVQNRNILLAEVLLNMDKIRYNIKDVNKKTAKDLLAQVCKEDKPWNQMCENIGFDPNLRTSYFERKTDLLEVRNTLSVVAALLATITFTAGFTLPGGLNQETGEAMMVNKAIFAVFLLSDTLSMCFSMVVLISLIWSMTLERNRSLFLIDQSVGLLKLSLYLTLIAFVSGVYIVTSTKLLWAAILVIVLCSLVAVSASRQLLYKVLTLKDNLFSFVNDRCIDPINRMEQGLSQCLRGESSNQNTALHLHTS